MDAHPHSDLSSAATQPSSIPTNQQLRDLHSTTLLTLSELFTTALDGNLQLDALHREVELWKSSYMQAERARGRLEVENKELKGDGAGGGGAQFTAILIDGDGAIFETSLLQQGALGGRLAAKLLLSSLPSLIQSTVPHLAKTRGQMAALTGNVVVNVVVNRFGLAGALFKAGLIKGVGQLNDFLLGLGKAHDSLNVIDAGPGKEASDSKIMAQLRFYGGINQCGLIVLAGSHDNGYANPVRSLVTEGKNIVILEGVPVAAELDGICPVARVEGLLRSDKVKISDNNGSLGQAGHSGGGISSGTSNVGANVMHLRQQHQQTPSKMSPIVRANRREEEMPTMMVDEEEASDDYTDVSDDEVEEIDFEAFDKALRITPATAVSGKKTLRGVGSTQTPSKSTTRRGLVDSGSESAAERSGAHAINLNTQQQHAPTTTINDKDKIGKKEKKISKKGTLTATAVPVGTVEAKVSIPTDEKALRYLTPRPCHKHYLTQSGCDNKSCTFGHDYTLNNKQLMYLAKLVKDMPCPFAKLGRCTENAQTCIYGHICPHAKDCTWGATCRFNELPDGGHGSWVLY